MNLFLDQSNIITRKIGIEEKVEAEFFDFKNE